MVVTCQKASCKTILSSACVFYEGQNLLFTGIKTNDPVEIVIQKLDTKLRENSGGQAGDLNNISDYRSAYDSSENYAYAGYLINNMIRITRTKDGNLQNATNLTNLESDWNNRLNLTYI